MPGSVGSRKNKRRRLSASTHAHDNVDVNTSSSHDPLDDSSGELTAFPNHGQVVNISGELTASPDHDQNVHTCREPIAASSHAQHDLSSNELTASTTEANVTKVTNLSAHIPSGTLTYGTFGTLSSEVGNPSEQRYSDDAGNNETSNMADVISDASSDELQWHSADEDLLSVINSESSSEAVSILTRCSTVTQEGLNQALISACSRGHQLLVETLVWVGANIEHPDENGNTPLLICAENGFTNIVRFLVSQHANVRAVNSVGNTALILSVRSAGSTDLTRFLLRQRDVDIHHQNQHGQTALHRATHFMDVDTMRLLLQKSRRNTHTGYLYNNEFGYETDRYVTSRRSAEIKQEVIAARVGLSGVYAILKEHARTGASPLELAIKSGDITSLNKFLDCQFSSSSNKKKYVDSALMYMFTNSRQSNSLKFSLPEKKIIQRLLENGANVNQGLGPELLSRAVESGDCQLVELLCTHSACVITHSYSSERDPLCIAAKAGRRDLVELLLKYSVHINRGGFPDSALDLALRNNHIECAKLLIQHRAKMEVKFAMSFAIDHQTADYVHFLIENYKPEIMDHFLQSPHIARGLLISAVKNGNCDIIGQILDAGVSVNEVVSNGQTPLMTSTSAGVAQFLIQRGADVNQATTGINGIKTPLIHMIQHRICTDTSTVELCQVLIDHGALVNCRSGEGKTPLMLAASQGECVGLLQKFLDKGAEVNNKDNSGDTALMHAIQLQYSENVCCLIDSAKDKKIVINVHNNKGLTPLMVCAKKGNIQIMKVLIEGRADVNMKDNHENTALHHLLIANPRHCEEMLACLLKAGSNVNCQNSVGLSPLMLAARKSTESFMTSLIDAGADVNTVSKNNHSQTALSVLLDTEYHGNNTILCIETLLDRGARSSYLSHECLHKLIIQNKINIIPKLIQCGVGPADAKANIIAWRRVASNIPSTMSPLCVALLCGRIPLARYFVDILFLTSSDLSMFACNKAMRSIRIQRDKEDSLNLLQELSSQPMSLVQLSLVAVSSAVGPCPGRETKVDSLPLPQMMKNRLLFKSADDKHLLLSRAPSASNITASDYFFGLLRDHRDMLGYGLPYSDDKEDFFYPLNS